MIVILGSVPVGLLTGGLAWLLAGGASAGTTQIGAAQERLTPPKPVGVRPHLPSHSLDGLLATPLFGLTLEASAVAEPTLRLDGLSHSALRAAALLSINGAPASWMVVGEDRDGVTLRDVTTSKAVVDTPNGSRTLSVGEQTQAQSETAGPLGATVNLATSDHVPPGFKSPPPPASAPAVRR